MVKDIPAGAQGPEYAGLDKDDVLERSGWNSAAAHGQRAGDDGIFAAGCLVGAGIGLAFAPRAGDFRTSSGTGCAQGRRAGREPGRDEPVADAGHIAPGHVGGQGHA